MVLVDEKNGKAISKSLSGLAVNLSAAWFGVAFITPNFVTAPAPGWLLLLLGDLGFGILFLVISFKLERSLL